MNVKSFAMLDYIIKKGRSSNSSDNVLATIDKIAKNLNEKDKQTNNPLTNYLLGLHPMERTALEAICREREECTINPNSIWESPLLT